MERMSWILISLLLTCCPVLSQDEEGSLHLNLHEFGSRLSRQFKDVSTSNGDVAIGLIDALQRWADALEAQITIMRSEVSDLDASNKKLREEMSEIRSDNSKLRLQVSELAGGHLKASEQHQSEVNGVKNDLKVFTKSFSDFIKHYERSTTEGKKNNSLVNKELDWVKGTVKDLSAILGERNKKGTVQKELEGLKESVAILTQADYILEERIRSNENRTELYYTTVTSEIAKLRSSSVNIGDLKTIIANVSGELQNIKTSTDMNITTIALSVKALDQSFKMTIHNSSSLLDQKIKGVNSDLITLREDVQVQAEAFTQDFMSFRKSIDFAKDKYDELAIVTDTLERNLGEQAQTRTNMTTALLRAMNEFGNRLSETESEVKVIKPDLEDVRESLKTFIGQMGREVGDLQGLGQSMGGRISSLEAGLEMVANETIRIKGRVQDTEFMLDQTGLNITDIGGHVTKSIKNHTVMLQSMRNMEKYFIDLRTQMFEKNLQIVALNDSITELKNSDQRLERNQADMAAEQLRFSEAIGELEQDVDTQNAELLTVWNNTISLNTRYQNLSDNLSSVSKSFGSSLDDLSDGYSKLTHKSIDFERGMTMLANQTLQIRANFTNLLVFSAANKAEVLELKVLANGLEDKIDRLHDLHDQHRAKVEEKLGDTGAHVVRLKTVSSGMQTDLESTNDRLQNLEELLADYQQFSGQVQSQVRILEEESEETQVGLSTLKLDMETVRASTQGLDGLLASVKSHIDELTTNVTLVDGAMTLIRSDMKSVKNRMDQIDVAVGVLNTNVADNRNGLILADDQFHMLRLNSSTLKANILGLGNYINNINSDVGKLAQTFESYIGDMTKTMVVLANNVTAIEEDFEEENANLAKRMLKMETITSDMKSDIATLTSKTYDMKTTVFEHGTEISTLRADQNNMLSTTNNLQTQIKAIQAEEDGRETDINAMQTDLATLRTGLTSLTGSMFNLKTKLAENDEIESRISSLTTDLSEMGKELEKVQVEIVNIQPAVGDVKKDVASFKTSIRSLATDVANRLDPPRFSCSVTSDEIRTSGVIKYNVCNINQNDLMNRDTGHVTIEEPGDYYLSFSGNMVSVNAQAVWCALYKQSAGNEGWQVLGMINNYQRNGENMDDRDSGSISVIASLKKGDQVWVEWRGYGDSFLYSNPYRLISFSGFMIKHSLE